MTTSSLGAEGSGSARSPHARRPTVLVASGDGERREGWAASFEAEGARVLRCAGPSVACALLAGRVRCPLLDDAALAVYDVESVPPEFLLRLYRLSPRPGVLFARDTVDERGQHRPTVERFATERRAAECPCFGSF